MNDESTPERRDTDAPPTLRLKSVSVALTVDDIEESLRWYSDIVGFHVRETFEDEGELRGAALVAGDQMLVISQDDWSKGRDRNKGQGIRVYLQTSQDVDQVAAAIKARGGELASEPQDMPWGDRAFNLVDPTGYLLTIST